jgi:hypothetical protein
MDDAMADRTMTAGEAKSLLREAVTLNLQHQRTGREVSRFSQERDEVVALLTSRGQSSGYAAYTHPGDV